MKKILKMAFVAAFAAVAGYGVYANQQSEAMSDLMLALMYIIHMRMLMVKIVVKLERIVIISGI